MNTTKTAALAAASALFLAISATTATDAGAAIANRPHYAAGNFELTLDGLPAGFVTGIDGGTMVADVVAEPGTRGSFVKKRISSPRFDPLVFSIAGASLSRPWLDWMNAGLAGGPPKNGTLAMLDFDYKEQSRRTFTNLRLTELVFPKLDAKDGKKPLDIELTLVGDTANEAKGGGQRSNSAAGSKAKAALASSFRVTLPGLDASRVTSVGEISVKVTGVSSTGSSKFQTAQPGRAEVGNFSVRISDTTGADSWRAWYQSFVVRGQATDSDEKTMTIECLSQDLKTVLMRVRLEGVGILNLSAVQADAGSAALRELQADLYAESFRFEP